MGHCEKLAQTAPINIVKTYLFRKDRGNPRIQEALRRTESLGIRNELKSHSSSYVAKAEEKLYF